MIAKQDMLVISARMFKQASVFFLLFLAACSPDPTAVRSFTAEPFPKHLSEWNLFQGRLADLRPNPGVIPYDLNTPLFSDYAAKYRTVWMPKGQSARYDPVKTFQFPAGTIISKTFSFNDKRIETRLLVNTGAAWVPLPYVWNADQNDAVFEIAADPRQIQTRSPTGDALDIDYLIPNVNQCKNCHESAHISQPIGLRARHLNRTFPYAAGPENQIAYWTRIGYLAGAPADPSKAPRLAVWNDPSTGSLEDRARSYLDINCAHCHNPDGPGNTSGLNLSAFQIDPVAMGQCKTPVAAGRGSGDFRFAILPGHPEESILVHRMNSVEPKVMMPELGRAVVHREGVELIREWISSLKGDCEKAL
jgi:uncharacterized repeat protein (TIGR03806 family)